MHTILTLPVYCVCAATPESAAQVTIMSLQSATESITVEPNEEIDISWSPTLLLNADPTADFVDINMHELSRDGSLRFLRTLATDIPNSGSAQIRISLDVSMNNVVVQPVTPVFIQLSLAKSHVTKRKRGISSSLKELFLWSGLKVLPYVAYLYKWYESCEEWYATEDPAIGEKLLAETVCCPRTVTAASMSTNLQEKKGLINTVLQNFFHPNASTCYRQTTPR